MGRFHICPNHIFIFPKKDIDQNLDFPNFSFSKKNNTKIRRGRIHFCPQTFPAQIMFDKAEKQKRTKFLIFINRKTNTSIQPEEHIHFFNRIYIMLTKIYLLFYMVDFFGSNLLICLT